MAPINKSIRTYDKKSRKSVDVLNALLAQNLTKRLIGNKKSKVKLKELPPRTETYLSDDSLKVKTDDTFDKVLKGKVFNPVRVVKKFVKVNSSESDVSKSQIPQISVSYHSPIMTRKRKKESSLIITEVNKSPPKEISAPTEKSSTQEKTNSKEVNSSLLIEKEHKNCNFSSLSYIKIPKIEESRLIRSEFTRMEASYEPVFSDTFRERQIVHSSTPCIMAPSKKIVADTISPIPVNSQDPKLVKKSYDEIKKWDLSYPAMAGEKSTKTPSGPVLRSSMNKAMKMRGRKLSTVMNSEPKKNCEDWKLNNQPKVYLQACDIIDEHFKGFTDLEQSESLELMKNNNVQKLSKFKHKFKKKSANDSVRKSTRRTRAKEDEESESKSEKKQIEKTTRNSKIKKITLSTKRLTRRNSNKLIKSMNLFEDSSNQRYITLRRKIIRCTDKTAKDKSKIKKNISPETDECSSTSQDSKPLSISPSTSGFTSFSLNKPNVVSYSCEDLNQREREIDLPNIDNELIQSKNLCVDQKEFDTFMSNYYNENKTDDNVQNNSSIILINDSKDKCSNFTNVQKELSKENEKQSPRRKSPKTSGTRTKKQNKEGSSKVVVLSNISLKIDEDSVKIYKNIWHDHSYSSSPMVKRLKRVYTSSPSRKTKEQRQDSSLELSDIVESSFSPNQNKNVIITKKDKCSNARKKRKSITLKPGKSYRRSLSLLRRSSMFVNILNSEKCNPDCRCLNCLFREKFLQEGRRTSVIVPVTIKECSKDQSLLESYARRHSSYVQGSTNILELDDSVRNLSLRSSLAQQEDDNDDDNFQSFVSAKDVVLRRCGQTEVIPFEKCYPSSALENCQKIGEGVYGEVFLYRKNGDTSVMKIIPIEGDLIVNGEKQKKYEEIVTEIIISTELSNLRNGKINCTTGFSEVKSVRCIQGCYPEQLVDLWELYDENHGSENDSPQIFPPDQLYIVLELANGGADVESYVFSSALQVFSMFKQTACALAVAESQLKFEHRDLHWGNVLIKTVEKNKTLQFRLNGKNIEVDTHGVEVSIIDFTLSRVECDGVVIFNDLSLDNDLFVAKGDYQFEIYRLMQKSNGNNWKIFNPFSNILWLHYILDKAAASAMRYKNTRAKIHREYLAKLKELRDNILTFHSAVDFVVNNFI